MAVKNETRGTLRFGSVAGRGIRRRTRTLPGEVVVGWRPCGVSQKVTLSPTPGWAARGNEPAGWHHDDGA